MKISALVVVAVAVASLVAEAAPKNRKIIVALNDNVTNVTVTESGAPGKTRVRSTQKAKPVAKKSVPPVSKKIAAPQTTQSKQNANAAKTILAPAPVVAAPAVSRPAGTVSTPITKAKAETKPSPFSFKYRSYNAMPLKGVYGEATDTRSQEFFAWDRVNLTYSFTDSISLSLMPEFFHTWFGDRSRVVDPDNTEYDSSGAGYMGGTSLILTHSKIAQLKGDITLGGFLRYEAPTSEAAQKSGEYGQFRLGLDLTRAWGDFEVKPMVILRYFANQYNTSKFTQKIKGIDGQDVTVGQLNKEFQLYSLVDLSYQITKKLGFCLETGFVNIITRGEDADPENNIPSREGKRTDIIVMNPELTYSFNDNFALSVGYLEEANMLKLPYDNYQPFAVAQDASEAYFMTTVKF